jgi:hypothetical protein
VTTSQVYGDSLNEPTDIKVRRGLRSIWNLRKILLAKLYEDAEVQIPKLLSKFVREDEKKEL